MKNCLTFILACLTFSSFSQDRLAEYRLNYLRDYAPEGYENASSSTLDSVLQADGMWVFDPSETWSADSLFSVITIHGEYCVMHCKPFFESTLYLPYSQELMEVDLASVYEIIPLNSDTYLLLQVYGLRPSGYFFVEGLMASVFCYREEGSFWIPFEYSHLIMGDKGSEDASTGSFRIEQEHYIDNEEYLEFDKETGILSYQFTNDLEYWTGELGAKTFTGTFQWTGDHFEHIQEIESPFEIELRD